MTRQTRKKKPIKTNQIDEKTLNKLVDEINRLYILNRQSYLKQYIDKSGIGRTVTMTYNKSKPQNNTNLPLNDKLIKRHLLGKQRENFGVINPKLTKILTFDFDIPDDTIRKFYYRKVQATLYELGIEESNYIVNKSGKKGMHLTVFFDKVLTYKAKKLYEYVIETIRNDDIDKLYLFRPLKKKTINEAIECQGLSHGVKFSLCYHIDTGQRAVLLDRDTLEVIDDLELCNCEPLPANELDDILDTLADNLDDNEYFKSIENDNDFVEQSKTLIENNTPLEVYQFGKDEKYTASRLNEILNSSNAIVEHGTRNNLTFILAIYIKDQYGVDEQTCLNMLNDWLANQNPESYSTKFKVAIEENKRTVHGVYEHDYHLNMSDKTFNISKNEMTDILTAVKDDGKPYTIMQKSLLFALLIHAKMYTSVDDDGNSGIFFMTYEQIFEACPFKKNDIINKTVTELEKSGHIEIISRNVDNTPFRKKANRYRLTLNKAKEKEKALQIVRPTLRNAKNKTIKLSECTTNTFKAVAYRFFTVKELQRLKLTSKNISYLKS